MKIHSVLKKSVIATGISLAMASSGAYAISAGTDFNLSAKARAGGMGGAAYTMPQEASAAVFGNPATLTQFKGFNMNFGASYLGLAKVENQTTHVGGLAFAGSRSAKATSDADNYLVPDIGVTIEIAPGLVIGTGLEVDAGLGADYRDDPFGLTGLPGAVSGNPGTNDAISLPLNIELISFNANLAAGYQATEKLSVGAALTVGFALAQIGTAGTSTGLSATLGAAGLGIPGAFGAPAIEDFGGTTSSVHDIGFGGSIGATYELQKGVMLSAAYKTKVAYTFNNIHEGVSSALPAGGTFQNLSVEQPAEVIVGVALNNVLAQNLLVEADLIWKNWANADVYSDLYDNQLLAVFGAQYRMNNWTYRIGYSWTDNMLRNQPGNKAGSLQSYGGIPIGSNDGFGGALGRDVVRLAQMTLFPTIWEHTFTAGLGYNFTEAMSVDGYASYALPESETRTLSGGATAALAGLGVGGSPVTKVSVGAEFMLGVGINISMP